MSTWSDPAARAAQSSGAGARGPVLSPAATPPAPSAVPATRWLLALVAAGWLLPAVYGREPWKADEGYSFGIVWSILEHGDWLVPTLAAEPFMEKPPLVFWLGAMFARLAGGLMDPHVAARGANLSLALAAFGLAWWAARSAAGAARAWAAVLLLAAAPAWLAAAKYLIADIGLVPAAGLVTVGLVRLAQRAPFAGAAIGAGAAVGLMSKGVLLPGVCALTCVLLPLLDARYREPRMLREAGWALAAFCLIGLGWPLALWLHSPQLFGTWIFDNNIGRFVGSNGLGPPRRWQTPVSYALFLLPAWPLVLGWAWRHRRAPGSQPLVGVALFATVFVAVLLASATARPIYALPVLLPLAVVGAAMLPGTASGVGLGAGAGVRLCAGVWPTLAVLASGTLATLAIAAPLPARLWLDAVRPGHPLANGAVRWELVALAAAIAFAWIWHRRSGARMRPLAVWVCALSLGFVQAAALFLPAADARARYRDLFVAAATVLPAPATCVASRGLGETERGMLEYYTGVLTRRIEIDPAAAGACAATIEQERVGLVSPGVFGCPGAAVAWAGHRPGEDDEVFRVCRPAR